MTDTEKNNSSRNIPKLDDTNFPAWSMRMQIHLKNRGLYEYCINENVGDLSGAALSNVIKKRIDAVDTIMNYLGDEAFDAIITPEIVEDPFKIWTKILSRYASQSVNNKGRVWLKFMRFEFNGNLSEYISECTKLINEIAIVKLGVPDEILCYSILAKLSKNMWNIVDSIIMNEQLMAHPDATLAKLQEMAYLDESRKAKNSSATNKNIAEGSEPTATVLLSQNQKRTNPQKKKIDPTRICSNGKHNPRAFHPEDLCYEIHPELKKNARKDNAATNLTTILPIEGEHAMLLLNDAHISRPIVLDSGSSHHMVNNASFIRASKDLKLTIATGNDKNSLSSHSIGTAQIRNHLNHIIHLEDTLLVPSLNRCLISLTKLFKDTLIITKLSNEKVLVNVDHDFVLKGTLINHLLELDESYFDEINTVNACYMTSSSIDWHSRLGHPHHHYLNKIIPGYKEINCETCQVAKMTSQPFKSHFKQTSSVLERLHLDLVGPFSVMSRSGAKYFLSITDQYSGFKSVKFLHNKSDTLNAFKEFVTQAENLTGAHLKSIMTDGGGEFINNKFISYLKEKGVTHNVSPSYTPQHNGVAERSNRSIINKARCLMAQSKLPPSFWAEAINTATDLCNVLPSRTRNFKIPYHTWYGRNFNYDFLRPFGCEVTALIDRESRSTFKLDATREKGIFLGYSNDFSTYKVLRLKNRSALITHHVVFDELKFPGLKGSDVDQEPADQLFNLEKEPIPQLIDQPANTSISSSQANNPEIAEVEESTNLNSPKSNFEISTDNILFYDRRGNPTTYLIDRPICYLTKEINTSVPKSYTQAIKSADSDKWIKAIEKELDNMKSHNVWTICEMKNNTKLLNCTWVFKIKLDDENKPIEYKARLCAQGFMQEKGQDFASTFAPTGKLTSLRMLISYAQANDLQFHQIDISSAFLNAPLNEDVYL